MRNVPAATWREQLYTAAVLALLLATSLINGYVAAAIAVGSLAIGLVLFPELRRRAILASIVAAGCAILLVLLLRA
jgi:hypothetical protein